MNVKQMREKLSKFPDDMKVVGLGKARNNCPAEVLISGGNVDPEDLDWADECDLESESWLRREEVVVIEVYH